MTRNRPITELSDSEIGLARALLIHEDESVLAFNKPSGLACQTRNNDDHTLDLLLWAFAKSNGKRPHLVHRLDAATSGVILAAKTKPARAALSKAFEARLVKKTYLALLGGTLPSEDEGRMMQALRRVRREDGHDISEMCAAEAKGAQEARTDWQVLARVGSVALVRARPYTGRMHQIRAHFSGLDCPVLGDEIYGDTTSAPRLMLHAESLAFPHPSGEAFRVSAPVPDEFSAFAAELGLAEALEAA